MSGKRCNVASWTQRGNRRFENAPRRRAMTHSASRRFGMRRQKRPVAQTGLDQEKAESRRGAQVS
jgi:hypothetical protein